MSNGYMFVTQWNLFFLHVIYMVKVSPGKLLKHVLKDLIEDTTRCYSKGKADKNYFSMKMYAL